MERVEQGDQVVLRESRVLCADPWTVPLARRFVIDVLQSWAWDEPDGVEDAALLTTELATNAVEHARTEYTVTLNLTIDGVCIDVRDLSTVPPTLQSPRPADAIGGRGLFLVAVIAKAWGVDQLSDGKSVWFELVQ